LRHPIDKDDALRHDLPVKEREETDRRLIKRYDNRKLYDCEGRRYVTLEELGTMVAGGQEVEVRDQRTGEDLTAPTLAQVVLEGLRQRTARIPGQVLSQLIRLGLGPLAGRVAWPGPLDAASRAREEAEKIVGGLLARGRLSLEEGLALRQDIARSVHGLVTEAQAGLEARMNRFFGERGEDVLDGLRHRLDDLSSRLDRPMRKAARHRLPRRVKRSPRARPV
jgi:polyhydroxyalkanoate synthesis repressor PhaR